MRKVIEENERLKRSYAIYQRNAEGLDETTIDKSLAAILRFEQSTGFKPFKRFHVQQAVAFKEHLDESRNAQTGRPLGVTTIDATLRLVKKFFHWLVGVKGFKRVLNYSDVAYFNNTKKRSRAAHAQRDIPYPSMEAAAHAFQAMPFRTEFEKRDKALFAFFMLTGARVGAVASLKMKHVNIEMRHVFQDGREVNTKASKTIDTYFFPVHPDYLKCFSGWLSFLRQEKFFGPNDALFPKASVGVTAGGSFGNMGLSRSGYSDGSALNAIVRTAFANVQMPQYTAHSFRKTLGMAMDACCTTMEERKAWSLNLGHENLATTVGSYMPVNRQRQAELMQVLAGR